MYGWINWAMHVTTKRGSTNLLHMKEISWHSLYWFYKTSIWSWQIFKNHFSTSIFVLYYEDSGFMSRSSFLIAISSILFQMVTQVISLMLWKSYEISPTNTNPQRWSFWRPLRVVWFIDVPRTFFSPFAHGITVCKRALEWSCETEGPLCSLGAVHLHLGSKWTVSSRIDCFHDR